MVPGAASKLLLVIADKKEECAGLHKRLATPSKSAGPKADAKSKSAPKNAKSEKVSKSNDTKQEGQRTAKRELAVMAQNLVLELVGMIEEGNMLKGAVCAGAGKIAPGLESLLSLLSFVLYHSL